MNIKKIETNYKYILNKTNQNFYKNKRGNKLWENFLKKLLQLF